MKPLQNVFGGHNYVFCAYRRLIIAERSMVQYSLTRMEVGDRLALLIPGMVANLHISSVRYDTALLDNLIE